MGALGRLGLLRVLLRCHRGALVFLRVEVRESKIEVVERRRFSGDQQALVANPGCLSAAVNTRLSPVTIRKQSKSLKYSGRL